MIRLLCAVLALFALSGAAPARDRSLPSQTASFTAEGLSRNYRLYVPQGATAPMPLIIVLHGTQGDGRKMELGLGFDPKAARHGFAIAYPDAYTPAVSRRSWRWNDGRGTLESAKHGVDDVAFLRALVEDIARRAPIDRSRVFLTGASNGGMMTYRAACEAADLFAAIAPVIGSVPTLISGQCRPSRAIPILAINGKADPWVPYAGGAVCPGVAKRICEGGEVIAAEASLAIFAQAAKCNGAAARTREPPRVQDGTFVERIVHGGCAGGVEVALIAIHGGGHAWPPRDPQLGERRSGGASANVNATDEIVAFFLRSPPLKTR